MDNPTLIQILGQIPKSKLKLLELLESTEEPITPIWELEEKQQRELEEATAQALNYTSATRRLSRAIRQIAMPHSD